MIKSTHKCIKLYRVVYSINSNDESSILLNLFAKTNNKKNRAVATATVTLEPAEKKTH